MREKGNVLANANYCINQHYKPSRFKSFSSPFFPPPCFLKGCTPFRASGYATIYATVMRRFVKFFQKVYRLIII